MASSKSSRFTLQEFRKSVDEGQKLAMLTCYDYTTARLLDRAGVKLILVGDSAANVILGHDTTLPVPFDFMVEITAAVRRGAPGAMVFADMPFGSFSTTAEGVRNAVRMVKQTGCDCVKIECTRGHIALVQALADAGVAVFAHLGMTPQSVGLNGYRTAGKSAHDALAISDLATDLVNAGAAGLLLEAVPPQVSELVTRHLDVPVIGCGAGPACHAHVVVLHDLLAITESSPRFAPRLGDGGATVLKSVERFQADVVSGRYPRPAHCYAMPADELKELREAVKQWGVELK